MEKREDIPTEYYNNSGNKDKVDIKAKWWGQPKGEKHAHISQIVKQIEQHQNYRYISNLRYARLYANQDMFGLHGGEFARTGVEASKSLAQGNRSSWNVVKACIDTVSSKIAKNKPRPLYMTEDGDWSAQRKARNLTQFMQAQFLQMGTGNGDNRSLYGVGRQVFVDSCVFGLGVAKFYTEGGKVWAERVLPHEIIVDEIEGRYQQPRQIHQKKLMFRETVKDMFPQYEHQIESCESGLSGESHSNSAADMIEVTESWHLPSGEKANDGCRVMSISNCDLLEEPYKKDYFPFLFQRWTNNIIGFYGIGITEEVLGIQLEINKMLRRIAQAQHLMAVPQVWLEYASKTVTSKLNNMIGGQRYYQGRPPVFLVPQAMSAEVYNHLENQYRKAFEIVGVSQLSAQSKKPSGLDSGKALRTFQDIESERFALAQIRYEDFYMDAAEIIKDQLRDLAEAGEDPVVKCQKGDAIVMMKWKDVDVPDGRCSARPYPTSFLSQTPSGKLADVQELVQSGFFDREEGLEMLDYPDLKAHTREKLAGKEANRLVIDEAMEGRYVVPEPFMDIDGLLPMIDRAYLKAKVKGAPEDVLDTLRRLMTDVNAMITQRDAQAAPPPQPQMDPMAAAAGMGGEAPMAVPESLPVSDLIPQA